MKSKLVFICLTFFLVSCGNNTKKEEKVSEKKVQYKNYRNERFGYSIAYPQFLIPQGESGNQDGQKFISNEGTIQLWVYRSFKMNIETGDVPTLEEALQTDLQDKKVLGKSLKNNTYTVKSLEEEKIVLQHTLLIANEYYEILFIYPKDKEKQLKSVMDYVVQSFEKSRG
ncbi:MAG: hypothetical protein CSA15_09350 [Candidatus Delongbacteria bacterium]|nr:MAG: hypothetical protein CSA15_09350 [Candidatus Delongbacteria bacterium]